jgi:hypothetical protein
MKNIIRKLNWQIKNQVDITIYYQIYDQVWNQIYWVIRRQTYYQIKNQEIRDQIEEVEL